MPVSGIPITPPHYGSRAGIEAIYGTFNADDNADINSTALAPEIAARFESALTLADAWVRSRAAGYSGVTLDPADAMLAYCANLYAGIYLYRGRGEPATNGQPKGVMVGNAKEAENELDQLLAALYYAPSGATTPTAEAVTVYPTARATWGYWGWWPYYP